MSHWIEARMASLGSIGTAVKPGVSVGTRKPRIPSLVRAQITARSAIDASPIHRLEPLITQSSPAWLAVVLMLAGSLPASGSVRRQPALLLRVGAELRDGAHGQRPLHADEGPQPGVARLQFQRGEAVIHRTATGAAVPGQVGAEQAEPSHLRDDLGGKHRLLVPLL